MKWNLLGWLGEQIIGWTVTPPLHIIMHFNVSSNTLYHVNILQCEEYLKFQISYNALDGLMV